MQIDYLRDFVALSSTLNFTSASIELNMTQPALSNHIKALEKELGVSLIVRGSANAEARLTTAGKIVLERSQALLRQYDSMIEEAQDATSSVSGKVIMRLVRPEQSMTLVALGRAFSEKNPGIEMEFDPWTTNDTLEDIHDGTIDCGFCLGLINEGIHDFENNNSIEFIAYEITELVLTISNNDSLAHKGTVSLQDVKDYEVVVPTNIKPIMYEYRINGIFEACEWNPRVKKKYYSSYEELVLSALQPGEIILGDLSYQDSPLVTLNENNAFLSVRPAVKLYNCLAFRAHEENESVIAFKDYLRDLTLK